MLRGYGNSVVQVGAALSTIFSCLCQGDEEEGLSLRESYEDEETIRFLTKPLFGSVGWGPASVNDIMHHYRRYMDIQGMQIKSVGFHRGNLKRILNQVSVEKEDNIYGVLMSDFDDSDYAGWENVFCFAKGEIISVGTGEYWTYKDILEDGLFHIRSPHDNRTLLYGLLICQQKPERRHKRRKC